MDIEKQTRAWKAVLNYESTQCYRGVPQWRHEYLKILLKPVVEPTVRNEIGKVCERRPRKVATPTWEIRSSYPLRENIWEYLHEDKNFNKRKNWRTCNQTRVGNKRWRKTSIFVMFLLFILGVTTLLWMSDNIPETNLINAISSGRKLVSLLGLEYTSVDEECCYRLKYLSAAFQRAEGALRRALRMRMIVTGTGHPDKQDPHIAIEMEYIEGATVSKGSATREWASRVALWGVVPLWRAAPPPDTVLAARRPAPADCWPFSGSQGELVIDLPRQLPVLSVSVEHVRPDTARSAPKHFILFGVLENNTWITAAEGEYRHHGPAKQYYPSQYRNIPLNRVVFRVLTNHGNPQYTCVYRVHLYKSSV